MRTKAAKGLINHGPARRLAGPDRRSMTRASAPAPLTASAVWSRLTRFRATSTSAEKSRARRIARRSADALAGARDDGD